MLYVIRPYGDWIKEHVFAILEQCGVATDPVKVVNHPVSLDTIAEIFAQTHPDFVLVPYHAKENINGLQIVLNLREHGLLTKDLPILMPISIYAAAGFNLTLGRLPADDQAWFKERVCVLNGPFENHQEHADQLSQYLKKLP